MPFFTPPVAAKHDAHRLVAPFELFIDLVYVAAILHIGNLQALDFISPQPDTHNNLASLFYFTGLWLSWNTFNFYMVRYYQNDTVTCAHFLFVGMFEAGMAAFTGGAFNGTSRHHYAYCFLACRLYLMGMQFLPSLADPTKRGLWLKYCAAYGVSTALIMISVATGRDAAYALWSIAFAFEFIALGYIELKLAPEFPLELCAERHGELVMIAIGENIIQLVVRPVDWGEDNLLAMAFAFIIAFLVVLLYFECQPEHESEHAYGRGGIAAWIFTNTHCFFNFSLMGIGVGVKLYMKNIQKGSHYTKKKYSWFFCGMCIAAVICCNIIRLSHKAFRSKAQLEVPMPFNARSPSKPVHSALAKRLIWVLRFFILAAILILAASYKQIDPVGGLLVVMCVLAVTVFMDVLQRRYLSGEPSAAGHSNPGHGPSVGYAPVPTQDEDEP